MRRLIVQEFVTLDGLAAGPEGEVDFIPAATEGDAGVADNQMRFIDTIDTIVLGRATYELFAGYWPTATGDDKPFADKLNAIPKLVFSRTLDRAPWGSFDEATIVREEPREEVPRLRDSEGKDMVVWGSLSVAIRSRKRGSSTSTSSGCCPSSWVVAGGRSSQKASARSP